MPKKIQSRKRIKLLRRRLGISQERLAVLLGVSWVTVARWEKKKGNSPSPLALTKIEELEKRV